MDAMRHRFGFEPSEYQLAFLDEVKSGTRNVMLQARAGAAKSTSLLMAAHEVQDDCLFCAHNVHVKNDLEKKLPDEVRCSTIHGLGFSILRAAPGYRNVQVNDEKYRNIVRRVFDDAVNTSMIGDLELTPPQRSALQEEFPLGDLGKLVTMVQVNLADARSKAEVNRIADHFGIDFHKDVYPLLQAFVRQVVRIGFENSTVLESGDDEHGGSICGIDYIDMIWLPWVLKRQYGHLKTWRYEYVFVDEAQDLSPAQLFIVREMVEPKDGRMFFVADEFQSITGFAGADVDSVNRIVREMKCVELELPICYRCPTSHLELARKIVPDILDAPGAAEGLVKNIDEDSMTGMIKGGDMVICRLNAPLIGVCLRLISAGKPATIVGRGIDKMLKATIKKVGKIDDDIDQFLPALSVWARREKLKLMERKGDATPKIDAVQDRVECLEVIYRSARASCLDDLLARVDRIFKFSGAPIRLSSFHGAKGLEANRVFLLNFDSIHLNSRRPWQAQQERNARYVALTRAKQDLYMVETSYVRARKERGGEIANEMRAHSRHVADVTFGLG